MFRVVIFILILAIASCKSSKEIDNSNPTEFLFIVTLHDVNDALKNDAVSQVMNVCFPFQLSGPLVRQSDLRQDLLEISIGLKGLSNDRINNIRDSLAGMSNVVSVHIQKL